MIVQASQCGNVLMHVSSVSHLTLLGIKIPIRTVTPKGKPYPSIMRSSINTEVSAGVIVPKQKVPHLNFAKIPRVMSVVAAISTMVQMRPTQISQKTKKWIISSFPCWCVTLPGSISTFPQSDDDPGSDRNGSQSPEG